MGQGRVLHRTPAGRLVRLALTAAPLILLLPLLLLAAAGCREKKPETTTIHFVTWKPNVPEAWEEIYRVFREEHPGITVEVEVGPHSSTAFHDLLTQKLKNRSPDIDVFLMDVIWPPEFAAAGWALPLDELVPEPTRREFLAGAILANTYGGKLYGVPLFIDSGVLYYRKDLLEKYGFAPPATWEELVAQAGRIVDAERRAGNEIHGFSGQFKQYEGLVCDMMEYILSNGGSIIDPDDRAGRPRRPGRRRGGAVRARRNRRQSGPARRADLPGARVAGSLRAGQGGLPPQLALRLEDRQRPGALHGGREGRHRRPPALRRGQELRRARRLAGGDRRHDRQPRRRRGPSPSSSPARASRRSSP